MKAVHFGAGNIGRGFVGLLLSNAGYDLVFADVADALIDALKNAESYSVHEVGENPRTHVVRGFSALNSATELDALVAEIAQANVVTTAVGAHILKFVAPAIAAGIAARPDGSPRVAVMACENAINGTDILAAEIARNYQGDDLAVRALFANTAVDRIVPNQDPNAGLDVTVENFFEWAIDRTPFEGGEPTIDGVTWVDDLEPYIERKLFTVNTGHATSAWFGYAAGVSKLSDALADPQIFAKVAAVLKLSRNERFISPASQLAERGMPRDGLLAAVAAGLLFDTADDPESVEVQKLLAEKSADEFVATVTGLEPEHPLYPDLVAVVAARQAG
jgi:mannitol-1-phosphate 5-dehydrogenase